ncbi:MAG: hypothetical protein NDI94_05800 [Candidatus Woesearchaeota archaeon]|nr:hypothetical protein [Candidatus Woesearchaeota archaeon]
MIADLAVLRYQKNELDRFVPAALAYYDGRAVIETFNISMTFQQMAALRTEQPQEKLEQELRQDGFGDSRSHLFANIGVSCAVTVTLKGKDYLIVTPKGSLPSGYWAQPDRIRGEFGSDLLEQAITEFTEEVLPFTYKEKLLRGRIGDFKFPIPKYDGVEFSRASYEMIPGAKVNIFGNHIYDVVLNGQHIPSMESPLAKLYHGFHIDRFHNNLQMLLAGHIEFNRFEGLYYAETIVQSEEKRRSSGHMFADVFDRRGPYLLPVVDGNIIPGFCIFRNGKVYGLSSSLEGYKLSEAFGGFTKEGITIAKNTELQIR